MFGTVSHQHFHFVSFSQYSNLPWLNFGQSQTLESKCNSLRTKICFESKKRKFISYKRLGLYCYTYSVVMFTSGAFPTAFCTTRNSFVTISITWPVWNTKSPFFLLRSLWNKQPVASDVSLLVSGFATGYNKETSVLF